MVFNFEEEDMDERFLDDPVRRSKQLMNAQSRYHLEDVLNELKYSRPAWVQQLIHGWQNEVKRQRIILGEDDRFSTALESQGDEDGPSAVG